MSGKRRGIDQQHAGAHGGEILQGRSERRIGGEFVIGLDGVGRLDLRQLGRGAHARQHAIAGRRIRGDFAEGGFRLGVFGLLRSSVSAASNAAPAAAAFLASQYS